MRKEKEYKYDNQNVRLLLLVGFYFGLQESSFQIETD